MPSLVSPLKAYSSNFPTDSVTLVTLSNTYETSITGDNILEELSEKEIDEFESIIQNHIEDSNIHSAKVVVTNQALIPSSAHRRLEDSYNILRIDYIVSIVGISKNIVQDFLNNWTKNMIRQYDSIKEEL